MYSLAIDTQEPPVCYSIKIQTRSSAHVKCMVQPIRRWVLVSIKHAPRGYKLKYIAVLQPQVTNKRPSALNVN